MPFEPPFRPSAATILSAILNRRKGRDRRKQARPERDRRQKP